MEMNLKKKNLIIGYKFMENHRKKKKKTLYFFQFLILFLNINSFKIDKSKRKIYFDPLTEKYSMKNINNLNENPKISNFLIEKVKF